MLKFPVTFVLCNVLNVESMVSWEDWAKEVYNIYLKPKSRSPVTKQRPLALLPARAMSTNKHTNLLNRLYTQARAHTKN